MSDQNADMKAVRCREFEADHCPDAAAKHKGRFVGKRGIRPALKLVTVLLRQIQSATRRAMEESLRHIRLTLAQPNVLIEIGYGQAPSNAELTPMQSVTLQTMAEILASLERRDFAIGQTSLGYQDIIHPLLSVSKRKMIGCC